MPRTLKKVRYVAVEGKDLNDLLDGVNSASELAGVYGDDAPHGTWAAGIARDIHRADKVAEKYRRALSSA